MNTEALRRLSAILWDKLEARVQHCLRLGHHLLSSEGATTAAAPGLKGSPHVLLPPPSKRPSDEGEAQEMTLEGPTWSQGPGQVDLLPSSLVDVLAQWHRLTPVLLQGKRRPLPCRTSSRLLAAVQWPPWQRCFLSQQGRHGSCHFSSKDGGLGCQCRGGGAGVRLSIPHS